MVRLYRADQQYGIGSTCAFLASCRVEIVRSMVAIGVSIAALSDMVYRQWSLGRHRIDFNTVGVRRAWKRKAEALSGNSRCAT
ncbi:hypothetical protein [Bradyrhizobium sp. BR 1432]|uniref:hypothetical protein n=1 Tax=Bradyrhizobium sp. BR 1432 TaxID=3447966 RepID=UPI003EE45273